MIREIPPLFRSGVKLDTIKYVSSLGGLQEYFVHGRRYTFFIIACISLFVLLFHFT